MNKIVKFFIDILIFVVVIWILYLEKMDFLLTLRLCALCIFYYCIKQSFKQNTIVNIYTLFAITPFSLFIYSAKFSPNYLMELKDSTWIIAIFNIVAFLLAYKVTRFKTRISSKYLLNQEDRKKLRLHIYILGGLSILPFIFMKIGLAIPLRSFMYFFSYIGLAMAFKLKEKKMIAIAFAFILVSFSIDFDKNKFMTLAICTFVCCEAYLVRTVSDKRKMIFACLAGALFMILVAFPLKDYLRNGGTYYEFVQNHSHISDEAFGMLTERMYFNGPEFLKMPIMYMISPWNNLQYVMETQQWHTYGLWTLKPFINYLGLESNVEAAYNLESFSSFNTFTYITVGYKDFGYWGSIIISILLGVYVKFVFSRNLKNGSVFDVATCGLVGMAVFQMFFNNHFFMQSYPFTIFIAGYVYKKVFHLKNY